MDVGVIEKTKNFMTFLVKLLKRIKRTICATKVE
jgi:hypothetical protein